jgi:glutaminyl-peptide cyclotransferase
MTKKDPFLFKVILAVITGILLLQTIYLQIHTTSAFSAQNAFSLLAKLQSFGPRIPDSTAHIRAREFITQQLISNGWQVQIQSGDATGHIYHNLLARKSDEPLKILLGTHYDSRLKSDHDSNPRFRDLPVPGANDGGSSTAILLELSHALPSEAAQNVGLVFFDLEDQGNIDEWDWILGSREFIRMNDIHPEMMILLDMVGGYDQVIQPPTNSDQIIYKEIQNTAHKFGFEKNFVDPSTMAILDDHVPFMEAGIRSVDLIDINDPNWHTASDDLENVSLQGLERVGNTITEWILNSK